MRIIAGRFKRRQLKSVPGLEVRPTADRLRQALFDVLAPGLGGSSFWDVCAGTGAVGLEALSRGAARVTFSEPAVRARRVLEDNIRSCGAGADEAEILPLNWQRAAVRLAGAERNFHFIYYDPPWDEADYQGLAERVTRAHLLAMDGVLVLEHSARIEPSAGWAGFELTRTLGSRSTTISLLRPSSAENRPLSGLES